jgi:hypothetical protein
MFLQKLSRKIDNVIDGVIDPRTLRFFFKNFLNFLFFLLKIIDFLIVFMLKHTLKNISFLE